MSIAVYFDMDGVLVDWVKGYEKVINIPLNEFMNLPKEEKNRIKESFINYDFFYNLDPIERGLCIFNQSVENSHFEDPVYILSATGSVNVDEVARAKTDWCKRYLNGYTDIMFVKKVEDKYKKMQYGYDMHVLVDDRDRAIDAWHEHGGIGVKF